MRMQDVLRRPLITEKSTQLSATTEEHRGVRRSIVRANKIDDPQASGRGISSRASRWPRSEIARDARQARVARVMFVGHGSPDWKKAYVRLSAGEKSIDFFDGV